MSFHDVQEKETRKDSNAFPLMLCDARLIAATIDALQSASHFKQPLRRVPLHAQLARRNCDGQRTDWRQWIVSR